MNTNIDTIFAAMKIYNFCKNECDWDMKPENEFKLESARYEVSNWVESFDIDKMLQDQMKEWMRPS